MAFFAHVIETVGGPQCKMENVSDREGIDDQTTTSGPGSLTNSCCLTLRGFRDITQTVSRFSRPIHLAHVAYTINNMTSYSFLWTLCPISSKNPHTINTSSARSSNAS